jgi:hypothetical protein
MTGMKLQGRHRLQASEGSVASSKQQTEAHSGFEVLLPVAVGGIFLAVLVMGALLG